MPNVYTVSLHKILLHLFFHAFLCFFPFSQSDASFTVTLWHYDEAFFSSSSWKTDYVLLHFLRLLMLLNLIWFSIPSKFSKEQIILLLKQLLALDILFHIPTHFLFLTATYCIPFCPTNILMFFYLNICHVLFENSSATEKEKDNVFQYTI